MKLEGKIWKDGRFWLVEIPALDYMTQGHTKKEAYEMAADIVETGVNSDGFKVTVEKVGEDAFTIAASDTRLLLAHLLRRQRQKSGLTALEVSAIMGSKSPNAFGAYEQGERTPSFEKLEELLHALSPDLDPVLKLKTG